MAGGVLQGVRVVDLTSVVVGPVATMFLADYGADVIKIEAPGGDLLRKLGGASRTGLLSPKFLHLNRNKKSINLDLKSPDGLSVLRTMLAQADVCVSNMRPNAMRRLNLSSEELRDLNPNLIYCGLVGFGQKGRYKDKPAYDSIIQGVGGLTGMCEKAIGEPRFIPMTIADHTVGLIAAQMILLGLYHRRETGVAEHIEVPMFENMAAFVMSEHMGQMSYRPSRGPAGDQRVLDPKARPIPTKDGHVCVSANTNAQAFAFFNAIGRPELCEHPKFDSVAKRLENVREYFAVREEALKSKTTSEWLEIFDRMDVPAGPSHTLESLLDDEHLADSDFFRTVTHPAEGPLIDIALPNTAQGFSREDYRAPPLLGEHSREVLAELGYSPDQISALFEKGAVVEPVSEKDERHRIG